MKLKLNGLIMEGPKSTLPHLARLGYVPLQRLSEIVRDTGNNLAFVSLFSTNGIEFIRVSLCKYLLAPRNGEPVSVGTNTSTLRTAQSLEDPYFPVAKCYLCDPIISSTFLWLQEDAVKKLSKLYYTKQPA